MPCAGALPRRDFWVWKMNPGVYFGLLFSRWLHLVSALILSGKADFLPMT